MTTYQSPPSASPYDDPPDAPDVDTGVVLVWVTVTWLLAVMLQNLSNQPTIEFKSLAAVQAPSHTPAVPVRHGCSGPKLQKQFWSKAGRTGGTQAPFAS